jgi:hypothetical protein
MPKVSLKPVGAQIKAVQKQLRASRRQAGAEYRSSIDDLIQKLDGLHAQTVDCCPKGMDGLAYTAAKPAKKKTAKRRTR